MMTRPSHPWLMFGCLMSIVYLALVTTQLTLVSSTSSINVSNITSKIDLVGNASWVCLTKDLDDHVVNPCHSRLRLTPPFESTCGAVWSQEKVTIDEQFEVSFSFQVSNISGHCPDHNNVYDWCNARGGHGFAFVFQDDPSHATPADTIGGCQNGIGYVGINNSFAIEFDMWFNPEIGDYYDNHVTVQTMGRRGNTNDHMYTFAGTTDVPDLADQEIHLVKFIYYPTFDDAILKPENCSKSFSCDKFQSTTQFARMYAEGLFQGPIGTAWVFVDDMITPKFIMPLSFPSLMSLDGGKAYAGFTASTGDIQYQVHDVFNWTYCNNLGNCTRLLPRNELD